MLNCVLKQLLPDETSHQYNIRSRRHNLSLSLMTGILLLDSYFVTPISIFNISPSLPSQLRTAVTLTFARTIHVNSYRCCNAVCHCFN